MTVIILHLIVINVGAQNSKSFIVERETDTSADANQKKYTKVVFQFYDKGSKKRIKAMSINIDDIRIPVDMETGETKVFLLRKKYSLSVRSVSWADSEKFKIKIDPLYNYKINVYLDTTKEVIATNY